MMTSKMRKSPDFFKKVTRMTVKMRKKNLKMQLATIRQKNYGSCFIKHGTNNNK
jgi:hypothetical protein